MPFLASSLAPVVVLFILAVTLMVTEHPPLDVMKPFPVSDLPALGLYSRPHLAKRTFSNGHCLWICHDDSGHTGIGDSKEMAYNQWVDHVQMTRFGAGLWPAPLTKAPEITLN